MPAPFTVINQNLITKLFQKYISNKDIRTFKGNFFYYLYYRFSRLFFNAPLKVKIHNLDLFSNHKKNKTSHSLLQKCNFFDVSEINTIQKLSRFYALSLIDCGCNFGFYSFYTASLSKENNIISIEASKDTLKEFYKNLEMNNFDNIKVLNNAVSDQNNQMMEFHESEKDWESSLLSAKFNIKKKNLVETITIDSVIKKIDIKNKLLIIKIDVEGFDLNVLDGAKNSVKENKPFIIIEFSKYIFENEKFNYNYLKDFLEIHDYQIYSKNGDRFSVEEIINLLEKTDKVHDTIGNYYLISNDKKELKNKVFND